VRNAWRAFLHDVGRGFDCMSYTMTMDMPRKASAYLERRGPRFRAQLQSLVIAFVMSEMQNDEYELSCPSKTGADFARAWGRIGLSDGELDLSRHPETLRGLDFS